MQLSPHAQRDAANEQVPGNPPAAVAWLGWTTEALARARHEDKLILLTIASPTCDWRHLMDRESYQRDDIARLLTEHFVPVRVDPEERPDLGHLYSSAVQAMTGRTGWPLTIVLTPDLEPFFGGTYFHPDDSLDGPGLASVLSRIAALWKENRQGVTSRAGQVTAILRKQADAPGHEDAGTHLYGKTLADAVKALRAQFDAEYGGFGRAPKFPGTRALAFLLRYAYRTGDRESAEMVRVTLEALAAGGIHDHLGGGFHHYAADERWAAPHFEKRLPDQAGLALIYTEAYLHSRHEPHAQVARDICDYVLRSLTAPTGGFYASEGACNKELEERHYTWTGPEIIAVLGPSHGHAFGRAFGVQCEGGRQGPAVLQRMVPVAPLPETLEQARQRLLAVRNRRPRPGRDERIITAWNGQMIEALARAGLALEEPRYVVAAEQAALYLKEYLWSGGRLLRSCRDGQDGGGAGSPGYLEDYAQLGRGLLALYEATFNPMHLAWAAHLAREMVRLFAHPAGGFTCTGRDAEPLLTPVVDTLDGELPSGNAAAILFLLHLGALTGDGEVTTRARAALRLFHDRLDAAPLDHIEMLCALDFALGPVRQIVLAGYPGDPIVARLRKALSSRYLPNAVVLFHPDVTAAERRLMDSEASAHLHMIRSLAPFIERMRTVGGAATAHVCRNHACSAPAQDVAGLERQLAA
jgi:uncharacterized protein